MPTKSSSQNSTNAWVVFEKNLSRTRSFIRIFFAGSTKPLTGQKRGPGKPSDEEKELLRAGVIFSIGALDAYLSEVTAEVLVTQLEAANQSPSPSARTLLKRIAREIDTLALELALTTDAQQRRAIARQALMDHLTSSVSNHGTKAISATLERLGDSSSHTLWASLDAQLANWPALTTQGRKSQAILEQWTNNRHKIVHEGQAISVNGQHAKQLVDFVEALGRAVDKVALSMLPQA